MSHISPDQQLRWLTMDARPDGALQRRFRRARWRAGLAAALGWARGRPSALVSLESLLAGRRPRASRFAGLLSVPIGLIVASEGRQGDFDARFRPLRAETWDRWRSVALALERGDPLPPVELIAVGGRYAVRDGHHRISAAAVLGQREVDALVTVVEV